jgi:hypothetical protein
MDSFDSVIGSNFHGVCSMLFEKSFPCGQGLFFEAVKLFHGFAIECFVEKIVTLFKHLT